MTVPFNLLAMIVGSSAILSVGALAWHRNYHSRAVRSFFIATMAFAFWLITNYFSVQQYSPTTVDLFIRLTYLGGVLLLTATLYFCLSFPTERQPSIWTRLAVLATLIGGSILSMSRLVVDHIDFAGQSQQQNIIAGSGYWLYGLILTGIVIASMVGLRRNYVSADLIQRNQIRYVAFGVGMGTSLSIIFDVFLVLLNPRWGSAIVNLSITLMTVIFLGYGFIRHRYIDIHRLTAWLFTYTICLGLVAGLFIIANTAMYKLYPDSSSARSTGMLVVASLAIFALQPASQRIKLYANRLFSVGWYDSQRLLNDLGIMLAGELHLEPLLKNFLFAICTELQVVGGELIIINDGEDHQTAKYGEWANTEQAINPVKISNNSEIVIVDELTVDDPLALKLAKQNIRVVVPLQTRGKRVGQLYLGIKKSGDIFSEQDIAVLQILSNQIAVAIVSVQAYEQISHFNDTLQKEIALATARLQEAHKKLQLDDRMKTEFIVLTSHNLRTPLSIVNGYISMLEESRLNATQQKLLLSMKTGADRLTKLTEDLLAIDSIIAGYKFIKQPIKIEAILQPLIKEAEDLAKTKNLKFVENIKVEDVYINADFRRLSSAIRNLLNNAFKFTEQGQITLSAESSGNNLIISITDTGIGIAANELPNLFSRFHRATSSMRYNYEGVGIGLYLTNLIIHEHGGEVTVTSQLHKGSVFNVKLPLISKPPIN